MARQKLEDFVIRMIVATLLTPWKLRIFIAGNILRMPEAVFWAGAALLALTFWRSEKWSAWAKQRFSKVPKMHGIGLYATLVGIALFLWVVWKIIELSSGIPWETWEMLKNGVTAGKVILWGWPLYERFFKPSGRPAASP
jgi:hypothetical protein